MSEVNKTECKLCKQLKDRISAGYFPNGKDKKFIDSDGRQWMGKVCGLCNLKRSRDYLYKKRQQKNDTKTEL